MLVNVVTFDYIRMNKQKRIHRLDENVLGDARSPFLFMLRGGDSTATFQPESYTGSLNRN